MREENQSIFKMGVQDVMALKQKGVEEIQNYLINKLKRFQQGKSNSQNGEIMFEFARRLNTQEMKDISNFLSNHTKDTSTKYDISDDILGSVD